MLEALKTAWAWLAQQNADLPWLAVGLTVFAIVYCVRRFAPRAWVWFEANSPFVVADPSPVAVLLHKAFQAIPSVVLSAAFTAMATGGNLKSAVFGALLGLVPPLTHELMAWLPFIPYKGAVGDYKVKPPLLPLLVLLALSSVGCAALSAAAAKSQGKSLVPCDAHDHAAQADLANNALQSKLERSACKGDAACVAAVLEKHDKYVDERCAMPKEAQ